MTGPPVLRFAPSPNGPLHLGHALSALIGFDMARRLGGRFLLRIEDIDVARCREDLIAAIFEDLAWLGIGWEEPVLRQSQHFAVYAEAAQWLEAQGLLYPCFASRSEIWESGGWRAVRSRRRAALSGAAQGADADRDRRAHCKRRGVCAPPRHGARARGGKAAGSGASR